MKGEVLTTVMGAVMGSEALRGRQETVKMLSSSLAVTRMDKLRNEDIKETEHF